MKLSIIKIGKYRLIDILNPYKWKAVVESKLAERFVSLELAEFLIFKYLTLMVIATDEIHFPYGVYNLEQFIAYKKKHKASIVVKFAAFGKPITIPVTDSIQTGWTLNPLNWKQAIKSRLQARYTNLLFAEQVVYRANQCPECVLAGKCHGCGCTVPDNMLVAQNACSEGRWGWMQGEREWYQHKKAYQITFDIQFNQL